MPPVAARAPEYAEPSVPACSDVEVIATGDPTVIETVPDFFRAAGLAASDVGLESATVTSNEKFPPDMGVPEIRPVEVFRLSPAGRLPETKDQV